MRLLPTTTIEELYFYKGTVKNTFFLKTSAPPLFTAGPPCRNGLAPPVNCGFKNCVKRIKLNYGVLVPGFVLKPGTPPRRDLWANVHLHMCADVA